MTEEMLYDYIESEMTLAFEALSEITPVDTYLEIFEADSSEVAEQDQKNNKAGESVLGHLKNAIDSLIKMVGTFLKKIGNVLTGGKLSARGQSVNAKYAAAKKANPKIAGTKVEVVDINKFNNEANSLANQAESLYKQLGAGKNPVIDEMINKIKTFCGNGAGAFTVSIGMEAALQAASSSQEMAKSIYDKLHENQEIVEQLQHAIGEKEFKRFEGDLKSMTKKVSLRQYILRLRGYQAQSLQDAITKTYDNCESLFSGVGASVALANSNPVANDGSLNKVQQVAGTVKHLIKNKEQTKQATKDLSKGHADQVLRRMNGNEVVHDTMKKTLSHYSDESKYKRAQFKNAEKASKEAKIRDRKLSNPKNKNKSSQSMMDSITGRYDQNSDTRDNPVVNRLTNLANKFK